MLAVKSAAGFLPINMYARNLARSEVLLVVVLSTLFSNNLNQLDPIHSTAFSARIRMPISQIDMNPSVNLAGIGQMTASNADSTAVTFVGNKDSSY